MSIHSFLLSQYHKSHKSSTTCNSLIPPAFLYHKPTLKATLLSLKQSFLQHQKCHGDVFPTPIHAFAVKAAPYMLPVLLDLYQELDMSASFECASLGELHLVLESMRGRTHFESKEHTKCCIVLDSPCKTREEMQWVADNFIVGEHDRQSSPDTHAQSSSRALCRHHVSRLFINIDNMEEYQDWKQLFAQCQLPRDTPNSPSITFGFRINPQIRSGQIQSTSTCHSTTKFGVPLHEYEQELLSAYKESPWIHGIHLHVGSQGCGIELFLEAQQKLLGFISKLVRNLKWIDIGGGFPISYETDELPRFESLVKAMDEKFFNSKYQLITEYGRSIVTKAAIAVAPVQYVKRATSNKLIIITELGADCFLREAYCPNDWNHRFSIWDCETDTMHECSSFDDTDHQIAFDIAGPLCFSGDLVGRSQSANTLDSIVRHRHILVIHDAGGYTQAMYSRYNSRRMPACYLVTKNGEIETILRAETLSESIQCWTHSQR